MRARSRLKAAAVVVIVVVGLGMGGFWVYRFINEEQYPSCLGSLYAPIMRQKATQDLAETAYDWKTLSDAEFELVMRDVRGGDCNNLDDPKLDAQGNRINIAVRRLQNDGSPSMMIWSNGRDEISGTDDDVFVPFGPRAPYRNGNKH